MYVLSNEICELISSVFGILIRNLLGIQILFKWVASFFIDGVLAFSTSVNKFVIVSQCCVSIHN